MSFGLLTATDFGLNGVQFFEAPTKLTTMKHCNGCPINIQSEQGEMVSNYGCLPCYAEVMKWYKDTGKVWACHEQPDKPCLGFLKLAKEKGEHVSVNKNTVLITERTTLEEIYNQ